MIGIKNFVFHNKKLKELRNNSSDTAELAFDDCYPLRINSELTLGELRSQKDQFFFKGKLNYWRKRSVYDSGDRRLNVQRRKANL